MNKLSDNEIKDIRDTIHGLWVDDMLIIDMPMPLTENVHQLIIDIGKEFGYQLDVHVSDNFCKVTVTRKY